MSSLADVQQPSPMTLPSPISITQANKHNFKSPTSDYDKYRLCFGWVNTDTIRDTFKHTTQWGVSIDTFPREGISSPGTLPSISHVDMRQLPQTHVVESGVKQAQLFVGKESLVSDIYPMRSAKQFVNTLEDNICRCSAVDKLISDSAKMRSPTR